MLDDSEQVDDIIAAFHLKWKKYDLDASLIGSSFITACSSGRKIEHRAHAEDLGLLIFRKFARSGSDEISQSNLMAAFPNDNALACAAWLILDPHHSGRLTVTDTQARIAAIYLERKYLTRSLKSLESLFNAAGSFLNAIVGFFVFFIYMTLYNNNRLGQLLLSLSTLLVALSFSFGETARNIVNSFIYVFVRNAYDVGDRVLVPDVNPDPLFVQDITLLTTTFVTHTNVHLTIPNHVLYEKALINYHRSMNIIDVISLDIDARTPVGKLGALESKFVEFLQTRPRDFDEKLSSVRVRELVLDNRVLVVIRVCYVSTGQSLDVFTKRRHLCITALKAIAEECDIRSNGPVTSIDVIPPEASLRTFTRVSSA